METTQGKNDLTTAAKKGAGRAARAAEKAYDENKEAIEHRVDDVRDLVEDLRDRVELAFHERPYLLPVATGALGLGVGVLIGSKLSRVLFVAAAGAMLSDQVRGQLLQIGRQVIDNLGEGRVGDGQESSDIEDLEPSST
jgi:ElaB/YqjD/DUF883 family membrane-anchored ribosome-binding protein